MIATAKRPSSRSSAKSASQQTTARSAIGERRSGAAWLAHNTATAFQLGGAPVQAKVAVGPSNDRFEREADQMAERVTQGATAGGVSHVSAGSVKESPAQRQAENKPEDKRESVQRAAAEDEREEGRVQREGEQGEEDRGERGDVQRAADPATKERDESEQTAVVRRQAESANEEAEEEEAGPGGGGEETAEEGGGAEAAEEGGAGGEEEAEEGAGGGGSEAEAEAGGAGPEGAEGEGSAGPQAGGAGGPEADTGEETGGEEREAGAGGGTESESEGAGRGSEEGEQGGGEEAAGGEEEGTEGPAEPVQSKTKDEDKRTVQRNTEDKETRERVQRQNAAKGGEDEQREAPVQRCCVDAVQAKEADSGDERVQRRSSPSPAPGARMSAAATQAIRTRGPGVPLPLVIRQKVEPKFGVDFSNVRLHTSGTAQDAARALHARAFTHKSDIWLGRGADPMDLKLMAHELTHVVQQGHAKPLAKAAPQEPANTAGRPKRPEALPVQPGSAAAGVQRWSLWGLAKRAGGAIASGARAVGRGAMRVVEGAMELGRDALLAVVREIAPDFAELIERDGILGFLRKAISKGVDTLFGGVLDAIRGIFDVNGIVSKARAAIGEVGTIIAQLARNDCSGLTRVARKVMAFFSRTFGPVIRMVRGIAGRIRGYIDGIVETIAIPVFEFLSKVGGALWDGIKSFIKKIGDIFSAIKSAIGRAWDKIKGWFGIGADEGSGEGGGLWNWIKDKAKSVWSAISDAAGRISGPLKAVGGVLVALSPAGPVLAVVKAWPQLKRAFQWVAQKWRDMNIIVRARNYINNTLMPMLTGALNSVAGGLQSAAEWIGETTSSIEGKLAAAEAAVGGSALLAPLRSVVGFVARQFNRLAQGFGGAIRGIATRIRSVFVRVANFLRPVWEAVKKIIAIAVNPFGIPGFLLGNIWKILPDCLKGPLINFIIKVLLKFLKALPPFIPPLGLLWPLIRSGLIGFLKKMLRFPIERKVRVSNKMANIVAGGSVGFAMGYLKGLALGIWDGIISPFRAIADLFQLPALIGNLARAMIERFSHLIAEAQRILAWVAENGSSTLSSLIDSAKDLLEHPQRIIDMIKTAIQAALSAVASLGASFASRMMAIFEQPDEQIGEQLGTLTGSALVTAVLSFFTAGTAGAASTIGKVVGFLARIGRRIMPIIRGVLRYLPKVMRVIQKIARMFARARSAAGQFLQRIIGFFRRIGSAFRSAVGKAGRAIRGGVGRVGRALRGGIGRLGRAVGRRLRSLSARFWRGRVGRWLRKKLRERAKKAARFRQFIAGLRAELLGHREGIAKRMVKSIYNRHRARFKKVVAWLPKFITREKVQFRVWAKQKGLHGPTFVASVLMDKATRWKEGKKAVKTALKRMRSDDLSVETIDAGLRPIRRDYHFTDLHAEWDEREQDFNIMAAMSPGKQIAEKKPPLPETKVTWGASGVKPNRMIADPLTKKGLPGSRPAGASVFWDEVGPIRTSSGKTSLYIQGHLLNHNVHGPGTWQNLTPLTRAANADMSVNAEREVKQRVKRRQVLKYEVNVSYPSTGAKPTPLRNLGGARRERVPDEGKLASRITMTAWRKEFNKGWRVKGGPVVSHTTQNVPPLPTGL